MEKSLSIGAAAGVLGVCVATLRNWHKSGILVPLFRTPGGHRRYGLDALARLVKPKDDLPRRTIAYARVSTHDQKHDLETRVERLKMECQSHGWPDAEVIADLGSGMNYTKKGLRRLLGLLFRQEVGRLVVMRRDRLLRFGAELVFELCRISGCEVVTIEPLDTDPRKTIVDDVMAVLTVFSARSNGMRSHSNKKALAAAA